MQVPLLDLKPQCQALKSEIDQAMVRVCDSQYFILGRAIKRLEAGDAAMSACAHGICVSSGSDALLVALMVLDIAAGDEFVATPCTLSASK